MSNLIWSIWQTTLPLIARPFAVSYVHKLGHMRQDGNIRCEHCPFTKTLYRCQFTRWLRVGTGQAARCQLHPLNIAVWLCQCVYLFYSPREVAVTEQVKSCTVARLPRVRPCLHYVTLSPETVLPVSILWCYSVCNRLRLKFVWCF